MLSSERATKRIVPSVVELRLNPRHDIYHASYVLAAFASLDASRTVTEIIIDDAVDPIVPELRCDGVRFAIDLHDSSNRFARSVLESCDIYAKRSYFAPDIPQEHTKKIIPFGLNYACRTGPASFALLRVLAHHPELARSLRAVEYAKLHSAAAFECSADRPVEPTVFFQTRVWSDAELGPGDTMEAINGGRVGLVMALREAFGPRFKGGILPTPLAKSMYPESITTESSSGRAYLHNMRNSQVAISTRGLHNSTPFKVFEYLAGSKCIVTEPIRNATPIPLRHQVNCLEYSSIDECLAQCDSLLTDPVRATEMRHENWRYYRAYLRFDRRLGLLFSQASRPQD